MGIRCIENWCRTWKTNFEFQIKYVLSKLLSNLTPGYFEYFSSISLLKSLKGLRDLCAAIVFVCNNILQAMIPSVGRFSSARKYISTGGHACHNDRFPLTWKTWKSQGI